VIDDSPDAAEKSHKAHPRARAFRNYLIGGLLVWIPIMITVWVFRFLTRILDSSLVLLPPSYRESDRRYPVIYMHDGQNLFDPATSCAGAWRVGRALEKIRATGLEAIIVGVPHGGADEVAPLVRLPRRGHDQVGDAVAVEVPRRDHRAAEEVAVGGLEGGLLRREREGGGEEQESGTGQTLGISM